MKSRFFTVLLVGLLGAGAAFAQSGAQKEFAKLKTLAGEWRGHDNHEHAVQVSFRVISQGSALLSEIAATQEHDSMVTLFHLDGDQLLATHYCTAGNQPRMRATISPDGVTLTFDFLDATDLAPGQPGHMQRLVIVLLGPGHHTEEWHFTHSDGREEIELDDLRRVGP
jgi:hypothetical protein